MAGERLVKWMNELKISESDRTDFVFGEVIGISPLRVRVENRFDVGEDFLILSQMVKEHKIQVPTPATVQTSQVEIEGQSVVTAVSLEQGLQDIIIFRSLQIGDHVRMIRGQKSQLFYVIERG